MYPSGNPPLRMLNALARHLVGAVSVTMTMPTGSSPESAIRLREVKIRRLTQPVANPVNPLNIE